MAGVAWVSAINSTRFGRCTRPYLYDMYIPFFFFNISNFTTYTHSIFMTTVRLNRTESWVMRVLCREFNLRIYPAFRLFRICDVELTATAIAYRYRRSSVRCFRALLSFFFTRVALFVGKTAYKFTFSQKFCRRNGETTFNNQCVSPSIRKAENNQY